MLNDADFYQIHEIIGGEKFMAPAAVPYHGNIIVELAFEFKNYFRQHKNGYVFADDVDVHFPDGSIYKPDLIIVSKENENIINWNKAIYGTPDMVVEVLSRSTMQNDVTIKKDTYEKFGVKEYWIVNPFVQSIEVYLLRDGKYELDPAYYIIYNDEEWRQLNEEKKAASKTTISPTIFPEIKIRLLDIFSWRY
ncbi:MAG: Uma2 family endonuclease [Selenomonadaceae bacterium]|nr:Uma2 family endonuclease [Selenomonadaceae bacterium]